MNFLDLYKSEPLVINGAVATLVDAVIGLIVQFGIAAISPDQKLAIDAVVAAVSLLVLVVLTRSQVTPVAKVLAPAVAPQP